MNLCKLIDRMEYLLFALVLLPTFLVIGAAVVSLATAEQAMESELRESAVPCADEDCSGFATNKAVGGTAWGIVFPPPV